MARILKGSDVASALIERALEESRQLASVGVKPCLAILRVGAREDDLAYERGALKRCAQCEVEVRPVVLPEDVDQASILSVIEELNNDQTVHGILMLRPLPAQLDEAACCEAIALCKDVDGASSAAAAEVFAGKGGSHAPCTSQACMEILRHYGIDLQGKHVVVIGRSSVIGKPVAMLLLAENATVTMCHSRSGDLAHYTQDADIVVAAIGRAEAIGAECLRAGQTIIDVGINWSAEKEKLCGDVDFEAAESVVDAITPVPGGVGGVTTAVLASHVIEAAKGAATR